ncbi:transposable element Tcb2 transposase [Trichonephila clavipes]|nr:transposable element Tcb2 transposase [Trichonephila clavipes]
MRRDSSSKKRFKPHGARLGLYGGWCRRSQPRVAIWFCVVVSECGLTLSSDNKKPDLRSPVHFFRITSFNSDRALQYHVALMVLTSKKSAQKLVDAPCCWPGGSPTVTRSTIRADVGVAIVPQTISRHLAEANLKSKHPFRALPLTPEHRQLRLQWCQARSMWNVTDLQKVVLSDESRFVLGTDDNRVRAWRLPAYDSRSTLVVMRGTLTGQRYIDDILRPHTLPWPARSPDLSPVEHVWDQLKRQMPSCHSVHDLELADQDLWAHLPQDNIRCLINSMPDRVVACIAAGGGSTRY